jgi:uncharacterized protein (TIGR03437 family)
MKNRFGFVATLCALLLLALTSSLRAEALGTIMRLTPEAVVPAPAVPPTGLNAVAAIIIDVNRDASGNIIAGTPFFIINVTTKETIGFTGFDLREGAENANGPIRYSPQFSGGRCTPDVNCTIAFGGASVDPVLLQRVLAKPYGFYIDVRTSANPDGALRAQFPKFTGFGAPVIHLSDTSFLTADDGTTARVQLFVSGFDSTNFSESDRINGVLINGRPAPYFPSLTISIGDLNVYLGDVIVNVSPEARASGGTLSIQIRNSKGALSAPYNVVAAPASKLNSTPVITVDAAKYGNLVSPESIGAAFGSRLASRAVPAPSLPLPAELDGTNVYVNGVAAGLFYVSDGQANYAIPSNTHPGTADVVVVAKDGAVSRGKVKVAGSVPAIFTTLGNGAGAPAALASKDGQNFDIVLGNPDGSPVPIDAGDYVALFGTGVRFASTPMKVTLGGMEIDPLYFGPQGFYESLDQVNLRVPLPLAGKGDVDLVITLDGKVSNTVKLRIR